MLFPDVADWDLVTVRVADRNTKDALGQENAFAVVTKGAVAEIREESFGLVKPAMDREVVLGPAPEFLCAVASMFKRVSHR